jgi:hypothetical protein
MAKEPQVTGKVVKGVIVLTMRYGQELLFEKDVRERLSKELTGRYHEILEKERDKIKTTSCVVKIQAEVAGSPVVRALFELWKEVVEEGVGGQVICVDYPPDYIDSLTSLGLPTLPGFSLAATEEEAIQRLI